MPQCCGIWRRYKAEEPVSEWSPTAGKQRIWSGKNSFNFFQHVMIYDFDFVYWSNTSATIVKKQEKSKKKIKPELVFPLGSYLICLKENLNCSLNISSLRSNLLEPEIPQPSELQMYKWPRWQDYKSGEM